MMEIEEAKSTKIYLEVNGRSVLASFSSTCNTEVYNAIRKMLLDTKENDFCTFDRKGVV